jgi:hypothetical protein
MNDMRRHNRHHVCMLMAWWLSGFMLSTIQGAPHVPWHATIHRGGARHLPKDDEDHHRHSRKDSYAVTRFAQKSLSLTSQLVSSTVKSSGQAAFSLLRPKHVELRELWGLWRIDQQLDSGATCQASIELTPAHQVIVSMEDGSQWKHRYTFTERQWPKACKVEFMARAFLREGSSEPLQLFYKGYTYRKVADSSVIKITGTIYRLEKTGWRGKNIQQKKVGTFVARRRLRMKLDDEDEDNELDEDDVSDEEEEESRTTDGVDARTEELDAEDEVDDDDYRSDEEESEASDDDE